MSPRISLFAILIFCATQAISPAAAQDPPATTTQAPMPQSAVPSTEASVQAPPTMPAPTGQKLTVPAGTRLPLLLRNGINTRTAKAGDSVYFETAYPISQNNRIVIPIGSFVRGQLLESKRPGLVKGRGEIRMILDEITYPNGYTLSLAATPSSVDRDGREGVDQEGKIRGSSSVGRDVATILTTTAGGAFIGTFSGLGVSDSPGKGALIGGGIGGAAGVLAVLLTRGPEAEIPLGTTMDVVFNHPLVLDADHLPPGNDAGRLSQPLASPAQVAHAHVGRREAPSTPQSTKEILLRALVPLLRF